MNGVIIFTAILAIAQSLPLCESEKQQWEKFKSDYGKEYENQEEENMRKEIFVKHLHTFQEHNKKYEAGLVSHKIGVNQFADITREEFSKMLTPMNVSEAPKGIPFVSPADAKAPASIDWRSKGAVTPVKFQSSCGSCYTFSATGALEGQLFIKTGQLVSLSEQNLLDCTLDKNHGCNGGFPSNCFQYVQSNGGIDTEDSYPYENQVGQCRYDPRNSGGTDNGFMTLPTDDESALLTAVGTAGPVSVLVNGEALQNYRSDVFEDYCDPSNLNHAVLVVGYDTDSSGKDYWIVKNSWGEQYGEGGYVKLIRNKNQCGIAHLAVYPIV